VALARALVREPDVFLMDEPLSNLDALLRERTRIELKMLFSRIQATVIYVTHDQVEAMAMSDVVAVLNEGRIQQAGPPLQIYRNPANEFVAGFIGSPRMNFFPVRIRAGDIIFENGRQATLPKQFARAQEMPEEATLGFRPEEAQTAGEGIEFSGRIQAVEELGPHSVVLLELPEGPAKIVQYAPMTDGGSLRFVVPADKIHLFGKHGGESLGRNE